MASKIYSRRHFIGVSSLALAGSTAVLHAAQGPRFLRDCYADLTERVHPSVSKPDLSTWRDDGITATWLGHATVLMNFYGVKIVTDPVLFSRIGAYVGLGTIGPKRITAAALCPKEIPEVDLVLLSHAHLDHWDMPSLRALKGQPQVITAKNTSDLLEDTHLRKFQELSWGDKTSLKTANGDIEVQAFEVRHWGARWRRDTYRGYNGYVLRREGHSIIFGGDTAMINTFADLKGKRPHDLACMPIGAYNPYIHSHCNPEEAVQMANEAKAAYILPMHHSTFRFGKEASCEPLERFTAALSSEPERIALRKAGETFVAA